MYLYCVLNIRIKNCYKWKKKEKYERINNDVDINEIILIIGIWLYCCIFFN